jgi:hypothetical protein
MKYSGNINGIVDMFGYDDAKDLTSVDGPLHICGGGGVFTPRLSWAESVHIHKNETLNAPQLTEVGILFLMAGATLNAPLLADVGELNQEDGSTLIAPLLTNPPEDLTATPFERGAWQI